MFGGAKNTFGQQPTTQGFSTFNQPQQTPGFGQSAFSKPGGAFGTSFGQQQNTSVFGAQPAAATSLFGSTNPPQQQGFGGEFEIIQDFCFKKYLIS